MERRALVLMAWLLVACGGAAPPPARVRPNGPAMSYLHLPHAFLLRVDCAAIRVTPIAGDVDTLWRASPLFDRLASSSSFDPIRDLDVMVTTTSTVVGWSGGPAAPRWRVVMRHHQDLAGARALLGTMASARGEAVVWREGQGLPSAILPGEISYQTPHAVALTALHEAVVAPDDELGTILTVARDQASRREADADVIEPGLLSSPGELVHAETTSPPPVLANLGASAARASVVRAGQGTAIHLELDFPSATLAQAVAVQARAQLAMLGANALVASMGLARPLLDAQVSVQGSTTKLDTTATFDELASALQALAMVSAGSTTY